MQVIALLTTGLNMVEVLYLNEGYVCVSVIYVMESLENDQKCYMERLLLYLSGNHNCIKATFDLIQCVLNVQNL